MHHRDQRDIPPVLDAEKKKQYMQTSKIIEQYEKQHEVVEPVKEEKKKEPTKVNAEDIPSYNRTGTKDILNGLVDLNRRRRGVRLFSD